jgi:hypothetical protein
MIKFLGLTRPDRCELCRFTVTEARAHAPALGSITDNPYRVPNMYNVLVCKRMPPIANADGNGVSPVVHKSDYCGEFKVRDAA